MTRLTVFLYTVALPIFTGAGIYSLENSGFISPAIGNYFPDGLWAFALVSLLFIIWEHKPKTVWLIAIFVSFFLFEFSQASELIAGTGDIIDLAFYIVFSGIAIFLHKTILFRYAKR